MHCANKKSSIYRKESKRRSFKSPITLPLKDAHGMFPLGHHSAWTLLVGAQATPPAPLPSLGSSLWTPPQPGPSGAKPEILTHLFHGNQQRLEVFALPSLRAPCLRLSWLCVPSTERWGHSSLIERGRHVGAAVDSALSF